MVQLSQRHNMESKLDPLFEIGNGSYGGNGSGAGYIYSDAALVVYKNGDVAVQGTLKVAPERHPDVRGIGGF